ncbi:MAG: hypothetical protein DPW22_07365 [Alphaproteobacteria bacterium]|nr:hypothetical protein [Alphaproteobacteria bacterium]
METSMSVYFERRSRDLVICAPRAMPNREVDLAIRNHTGGELDLKNAKRIDYCDHDAGRTHYVVTDAFPVVLASVTPPSVTPR